MTPDKLGPPFDFAGRFGRLAPVSGDEADFIAMMHDRLTGLHLVAEDGDGERRIGELGDASLVLAEALHTFGCGALHESLIGIASTAFALALRCRCHRPPVDDRAVVVELRHWAQARHLDGEYRDALGALLCAQEMLDSTAPESDPESLDNRNDIALMYLELGDPRTALALLRPLVTVNRRTRPGGASDPETLTAESNLADALKMAGDYDAALALARRVQRDRAASPLLGPDHAQTLSSGNNIGELLQLVGDLPGALRVQEEVLARRTATQPGHPDTVTAAANLATTVYQMGNWLRALELEREVLLQRRAHAGKMHPDTLTAANNLAGTLRELGEFTQADELLRFVAWARRKTLGLAHPETLMALTNRADLLLEMGDLRGAGRLSRQAWREGEAAHSAEHPATVTSMASHAAVLHARGRHAEALRLQRRIVALRERDAGPAHPLTLLAQNDLAAMYQKHGELDEARALYEVVEVRAADALGESHPDVVEVRLNLAEVHHLQGRRAAALRLAHRVERQLGARDVIDARDFQRYGRLASLLSVLDAGASLGRLFAPVSARMWSTLETLDLPSWNQMMNGFRRFHDAWVRYSLAHALDDLPRALAPLHGLESADWVRASLDVQEDADDERAADPRARYRAVRQRLGAARQGLQQLDAQLRSLDADLRIAGDQAEPMRRARTQLRTRRGAMAREERAAILALQEARDQLNETAPDVAAGLRAAAPSARELQARLEDGEAIVFLVQLADQQAAALVLARNAQAAVALPLVEALRGAFEARMRAGPAGGRGTGLRDARRVADAADPPDAPGSLEPEPLLPLSELHAAVQAAVWDPLEGPLRGIDRLHVVHAPTLRAFALDIVPSSGRTCAFYASLPGLLRTIEAADARPTCGDASALDAVFDCAWGTGAPLPFTRAEALLIQAGQPDVRMRDGGDALRAFAEGSGAARMHIACHGVIGGRDDERHAVLLLDAATDGTLTPAMLTSREGTITEFVCSTCIGGIVSESVGVDALGVVSALQHHGARAIVACIAPVSDFHMPLLMALYWEARRDHAPAAALAWAKRTLLDGHWSNALATAVAAAYAEVMADVLARARHVGRPTGDPTAAADNALLLARGIASWTLSAPQRESLGVSDPMSTYDHERFSRAWCEEPARRRAFAREAADRLVAVRHDWPAAHRAHLEHVCAFTQCYGGLRE